MTRISLFLWAALTAVSVLVPSGGAARATELKVLASVALTSALNELAPENTKGDKLSIGYGLAADLKVHSRWRNRRRDHPNPADDG